MGEVKASDNDDFLTKLLHLHHEEPNTFPEALVQTVIKQNIGAGYHPSLLSVKIPPLMGLGPILLVSHSLLSCAV